MRTILIQALLLLFFLNITGCSENIVDLVKNNTLESLEKELAIRKSEINDMYNKDFTFYANDKNIKSLIKLIDKNFRLKKDCAKAINALLILLVLDYSNSKIKLEYLKYKSSLDQFFFNAFKINDEASLLAFGNYYLILQHSNFSLVEKKMKLLLKHELIIRIDIMIAILKNYYYTENELLTELKEFTNLEVAMIFKYILENKNKVKHNFLLTLKVCAELLKNNLNKTVHLKDESFEFSKLAELALILDSMNKREDLIKIIMQHLNDDHILKKNDKFHLLKNKYFKLN